MFLLLVLLILVVLYIMKLNSNADVINENCKTDSDAINVKNGQKVFYKTRESKILLWISIISLVVCLLCTFTNLGNKIIDYFSYDFYEYQEFNVWYFLIPIYSFVIREIIVQVKIGDFLYKYFDVKEPEIEASMGDIIKSVLYKKKPEIDVKTRLEQMEPVAQEVNETEKNES